MENKIDQIIARVLSGESSSEDILYLSEWLQADKKNQEEFCLLKSYWDAEVSLNHSILPILSMEKLQQKIDRQQKQAGRKQLWKYFLPLVASIALLLMLSIRYLQPEAAKPNVEYYTYLTNDNKTNLTMDDGTTIILNKHSRLTYSSAYGTDRRSIKLEGEAYFEVAKDSLRPFCVETGNSSITVLGTTFNVKNEIGSDEIAATLVEGSICFNAKEQKVILKPGQQLTFNKTTKDIGIKPVDTDKYTSWKSGLLKYRSVPFTELIAELKHIYKVEIRIENLQLTDPNIVVSGTFSEEQNIEQILTVIAKSLPFRWKNKDGVYYIR